jgi:hypothetical protein
MQVRVSARDSSNNQAAVELGIIAQSIPIFQFGVFFDNDLEIHPGPPMNFVGWVHTNKALYLSSNNANFASRVSTADSVFWQRKAYSDRLSGVRIANQAGTLMPLNFDSRSRPGASFVAASNAQFGGRLQTAVSGVRPLRLPLPSTMTARELVRPAQPGDPADVANVRMANKADLRLVVDLANTANLATPTLFCTSGAVQFFRGAGLQAIPQSVCEDVFNFWPNRFFDGRERTGVDLVDIDLEDLRTWINGNANQRKVSVIYIEVLNASAADANRNYPAVRLRRGARLPNAWAGSNGGLSVATHVPMYIWGDYNRDDWKPAAVFADALTFLSNEWNDGNQGVYAYNANSTDMTVNVALVAGNSETPGDWMRVGNQPYGGGLENFPRFLENWGGSGSGRRLILTGSLVCLFPSAQSTGQWNHNLNGGAYYNPPQRVWSFDIRFRDPNNLPPGTPLLGSTLQIAFRSIF